MVETTNDQQERKDYAHAIALQIGKEHAGFIYEISRLREVNRVFDEALERHSGLKMFQEGFHFYAHQEQACKAKLVSEYDPTLDDHITAHPDKVLSTLELSRIKTAFNMRTAEIMLRAKYITDPRNAQQRIALIEKDLVQPRLNEKPLFNPPALVH